MNATDANGPRIHIHAPAPVYTRIRYARCPTCGTKRRFLSEFYEWYGFTYTCLTCGDRWTDGEREPRPFERGWRARVVANAKERWKRYAAAAVAT